jgi:hypothetical protein
MKLHPYERLARAGRSKRHFENPRVTQSDPDLFPLRQTLRRPVRTQDPQDGLLRRAFFLSDRASPRLPRSMILVWGAVVSAC